jgi:hypothetical protein
MSRQADVLGGYPLPNCPYKDSAIPPSESPRNQYHNPAISTTYFVFVLCFLFYMAITLLKYSHVKIFNRSIYHPSIRNAEYSLMFLFLSLACAVDGIRYTLDFPHQLTNNSLGVMEDETYVVGPATMDSWLLLMSALLRSLALLFFSLALNQQIIHRSSPLAPAHISSRSTIFSTPRSRGSEADLEDIITDSTPLLVPEETQAIEEIHVTEEVTVSTVACLPRHVIDAVYQSTMNIITSLQFTLIVIFAFKVFVLLAFMYAVLFDF